jgi:glycosyltransferase involved in cell wall biosynthesis
MKGHKTRRILVVVNSLQAGGAEHAALRLSVDLTQNGNQVILCTLRSDLDFYMVPKSVQRINYGDIFSHPKNSKIQFSRLPILKTLELCWLQFWSIRRYVRNLKPDVVIAFEALIGSAFAISLVHTGVPIIISERVVPNPKIYAPHRIARFLRPWVYKHGAICTVQSKGFQKWVIDNWGVQAFVTPNHLHDSEIIKNKKKNSKSYNNFSVIAIGRLASQKDYNTLLKAWKIVEFKIPNARLSIFGDGDRVAINQLIFESGLQNVKCFSAIPGILDELVRHKILVSSSKFEGFPNVVLESLSCGIPVVATRSTDVIDDFAIHGGVKACNVSDHLGLAKLIIDTISNEGEYQLMKQQALVTAMNYGWANINPFWEEVLAAAQMSKGMRMVKRK